MSERVQLLHLYQPDSQRRLRVEVPTVFGRSGAFHTYTDEARFSDEEAVELQRLDYVEISGDSFISRSHGVLNPRTMTLQDLNSKNGTYINGRLCMTTANRAGPPHKLVAGDVIAVGKLTFVVQLDEAGADSLEQTLALERHAVVGPSGAEDARALEGFLEDRKRFRVRRVDSWEELKDALGLLRPRLQPLGVLVIGLVAEPRGDDFVFADETVAATTLLARLNLLPGSKIVAFQATGDPTGIESVFRDLAYQDTLLLTSNVPSHANLANDLAPEIATAPAEAVRQGMSRGTYDSVLDGLDALLRPTTNVLDVDWTRNYEGALRLVVGSQLHVDYEVELSYRWEGGDAEPSSFRVRHHFDSSRPLPDDHDGVVGSWQAPPSL